MRLGGRKLLGIGLILGGVGWTALRRRRPPTSAVVPERHVEADDRPTAAAGGPRGYKTVAVAFGLALLAALAAYVWQGFERQLQARGAAIALTGGEPRNAPALLARYGCGGCHTIPDAPGADGKVGPSLADLRERVYVGGVLRNTPANLVEWIVAPQKFSPKSAMPVTGITEAEARDVAAYLYAQ